MLDEEEWRERIVDSMESRETSYSPCPTRESMRLVDEALSEFPWSAELWELRGDLILWLDEPECDDYELDEIRDCYQRAMDLAPSSPEPFESMGYFLDVYEQGFEEAERCFRRAVTLGGGAKSWVGLARVLAELDRGAEALELLQEGVCPYAQDPEVLEMKADVEEGVWAP